MNVTKMSLCVSLLLQLSEELEQDHPSFLTFEAPFKHSSYIFTF